MSTPSNPLLVERFTVDPEVNDLDRDLKKRERSTQQKYALIAIPLLFVGAVVAVAGMYLSAPNHSPQFMIPTILMGAMVIIVSGVLGASIIHMTNTPEKEKANEERKESQQSIKRSVSTARALGNVVPTLTREYAEAGIRLDQVISTQASIWNRNDVEIIRSLLFSDLSRESVILSLIEDRGMTTSSQVIAALNEMDRHGKPLQTGWL